LTQFVAFLRGVNVGGRNIVRKEELREAFHSLGFTNVSTYKQSGNVVFETDSTDLEAIQEEAEQRLRQLLGRDVRVFLRTMNYLRKLVESNPFKNANTQGASLLVTFLSDRPPNLALPLKIPKSKAEVILIDGYEAFSTARGYGDGGKPNPFIESKLKIQATTRNWNIIKEITEEYSGTNMQERPGQA
jgi:uncharacterized protein (DUF1697 family)